MTRIILFTGDVTLKPKGIKNIPAFNVKDKWNSDPDDVSGNLCKEQIEQGYETLGKTHDPAKAECLKRTSLDKKLGPTLLMSKAAYVRTALISALMPTGIHQGNEKDRGFRAGCQSTGVPTRLMNKHPGSSTWPLKSTIPPRS